MEDYDIRAVARLVRAEKALDTPYKPRGQDGWVYLIGAPFVPAVKIGWAVNPILRYDEISKRSPTPVALLTGRKGSLKDEQALHRKFKAYRYYGEWFRFEGEIVTFHDELREKNGACPWPPLPFSSSVREPRVWFDGNGREIPKR
jgi:hypothetical protein